MATVACLLCGAVIEWVERRPNPGGCEPSWQHVGMRVEYQLDHDATPDFGHES